MCKEYYPDIFFEKLWKIVKLTPDSRSLDPLKPALPYKGCVLPTRPADSVEFYTNFHLPVSIFVGTTLKLN
jgi:hypothetical protein